MLKDFSRLLLGAQARHPAKCPDQRLIRQRKILKLVIFQVSWSISHHTHARPTEALMGAAGISYGQIV
jgi:hypothetical protein